MILARVFFLVAVFTSASSFHASCHHIQRDASPTFLKLSGGDAAVPELKVYVGMVLCFHQTQSSYTSNHHTRFSIFIYILQTQTF